MTLTRMRRFFRVMQARTGVRYQAKHVRTIVVLTQHLGDADIEPRLVAFVKALQLPRVKQRSGLYTPVLKSLHLLYHHVARTSSPWILRAVVAQRQDMRHQYEDLQCRVDELEEALKDLRRLHLRDQRNLLACQKRMLKDIRTNTKHIVQFTMTR